MKNATITYTPDDFRRDGEAWGGSDWQRPLSVALVTAGLLSGSYADVTVRRYVRGVRSIPADIRDWLLAEIETRDAWGVGVTERGLRFVTHLLAPRFIMVLGPTGKPRSTDWFDAKPAPRLHGKLIAEAIAQLSA